MSIINVDRAEWLPLAIPEAGGSAAGEMVWIVPDKVMLWRGATETSLTVAPYLFEVDETVYLLEGSATVTLESGAIVSLTAGDFSSFMAGARGTWAFDFPVVKLSIFH